MNIKLTNLSDEYSAWCIANGLPLHSAEELIHGVLTSGQRAWISNFIDRWDDADYEYQLEIDPMFELRQ